MRVQEIDPGQYEALGEVTVRAYRAIPGRAPSPEYERALRDVAGRADVDRVLVAVAEFEGADRAAFRMLAVDPEAQGAGAGRALIEACIGVARAEGKRWLTLMTTEHMDAARRLYERLGFRRAPEFDMMVEEGRLQLVSYVLELN